MRANVPKSVCLVVVYVFMFSVGANCTPISRYVGCISNRYGRSRLTQLGNVHSGLTVKHCTTTCFQKGYLHAAMKNGNTCYCADLEDNPVTVKETTCKIPCSGDPSLICGGPNSFSGYTTGIFDAPVEDKLIGCVRDGWDRLLPQYKLYLPKTNSPRRCAGICNQMGFKHAGLKKGYECYCGDAGTSTPTEVDCSIPCPSNSNLFCGGNSSIMVYKSGVLENLPVPSPSAKLLGCYKNRRGGLFTEFIVDMPQLTPTKCVAKCFSLNVQYAALFNGTECQCGKLTHPLPEAVPDRMCTSPCAGDSSKICGSPYNVSPYTTGIIGDPVLGRSIGCFAADESFGLKMALGQQNKPVYCIIKCMELGYMYAGLQNTYECVCSNIIPIERSTAEVKEESCSAPCPQLPLFTCGGQGFLYIYRTGIEDYSFEKACSQSVTKTNGGQPACGGKIIFQDNFRTNQLKMWLKTVKFSGEDFDFVVYNADEKNVYTSDGKLVIKPTIFDESFILNGTLILDGCTGRLNSEECEREAKFYSILPPIQSAQICTKNYFNFRYGIVTVRAKTPVGDWIAPEISLKPLRDVYGTGYKSGKLLFGLVRGNNDLVTASGKDVGSNVVEASIIVSTGEHNPSAYKRKSVSFRSSERWNSAFHNYTLIWNPDYISFYVDNRMDEAKNLYELKDKNLIKSLGLSGKPGTLWHKGTHIAPFDDYFQICLGVSVGGSHNFPDDSTSRGKPKPWGNLNVKGMLNFWQARNDWLPSWIGDIKMEVESVTVKSF